MWFEMLNRDEGMPTDPFSSDTPDLTQFAANCRGMYTSLVAAGFKEPEALEIMIRVTSAMFMKLIP
jgi:hypothetical protein